MDGSARSVQHIIAFVDAVPALLVWLNIWQIWMENVE
jgi:hypothetical protein